MSAASTVLPSGQVLVAGGWTGTGTLASAELYDPATGSWQATGSMAEARYGAAAAVLPDGRALVIGGLDPTTASVGQLSESTEIYSPATGAWSAGPSTSSPHVFAATATLADGKVLVAGGSSIDVRPASIAETWIGADPTGAAEIYDPATSTWQATGSMLVNDSHLHAVVLPDGRVFTGCGTSAGNFEIYNPGADPTVGVTGLWRMASPAPMTVAICSLGLLPDGRVLVAGGQRYDQIGFDQVHTGAGGTGVGGGAVIPLTAQAAIYDPTTDSWSSAGSMGTPREWSTATTLRDGRVLVSGGEDPNNVPLTSTEIFDPSTGTWAASPSSTPSLQTARLGGETTALLADGTVLIAGGESATSAPGFPSALTEAEIVTP